MKTNTNRDTTTKRGAETASESGILAVALGQGKEIGQIGQIRETEITALDQDPTTMRRETMPSDRDKTPSSRGQTHWRLGCLHVQTYRTRAVTEYGEKSVYRCSVFLCQGVCRNARELVNWDVLRSGDILQESENLSEYILNTIYITASVYCYLFYNL